MFLLICSRSPFARGLGLHRGPRITVYTRKSNKSPDGFRGPVLSFGGCRQLRQTVPHVIVILFAFAGCLRAKPQNGLKMKDLEASEKEIPEGFMQLSL